MLRFCNGHNGENNKLNKVFTTGISFMSVSKNYMTAWNISNTFSSVWWSSSTQQLYSDDCLENKREVL